MPDGAGDAAQKVILVLHPAIHPSFEAANLPQEDCLERLGLEMPQQISTMKLLEVLLGVATTWPSFVRAQRLQEPEMQEKCNVVRQSCVCNGSTGDVQVMTM